MFPTGGPVRASADRSQARLDTEERDRVDVASARVGRSEFDPSTEDGRLLGCWTSSFERTRRCTASAGACRSLRCRIGVRPDKARRARRP